jgi:hypothetical protein
LFNKSNRLPILVQNGTSLLELMELGGRKSYKMVLRYAHLAPEKLSLVAGCIERQASKLIEEAQRVKNVTKNARFCRGRYMERALPM